VAVGKEAIGKTPERYKLVTPGTIFYNPMRILLGSIAFVGEGDAPGITSPDYVVFRAREGLLHPVFFYYWLRSTEGDAFIRSMTRGAVRERMLFRRLVSGSLDLPPWEVQCRAAEQLAWVARARAAAKARLETVEVTGDIGIQYVLQQSGGSPWPRLPLGELLAAPLKTGISRPTVPDAQKRCLTLASVRAGRLDLKAAKTVELTDAEAKGNWVLPGAFYVVRGNGNLSLVGRGAEAPTSMPPVLYPDLLIQVVADPGRLLAKYLRVIWAAPEVRRDIESRARTSAGIHKINLSSLARVQIPLPNLADQDRIAYRADELADATATVREAATAEMAAINALPAALLRRAFTGEL